MNIDTELKKDGISVIEPLDEASVNTIAKNVSKKIANAFPNFGFSFDSLYYDFSGLSMYIADIPEGLAEASYFYKNSSVYFRDGMGLSDMEKFAVHELIHHLQEIKDEKGKLVRLGLCTFKGSKPFGMALNEAAVQTIAANVLGSTFENVTYYDINFSTISPNCYPIICNLIAQMAYVTGEEVLFDSTLNSNDHFKNKFSAICGTETYKKVSIAFDAILKLEENLSKLNSKIQFEDLSTDKTTSLYTKMNNLKIQIRKIYFECQELIVKSFFDSIFKSLINSEEIDGFRKRLYSFQELIGTADNYYFFNNYYIEMMEKLDKKFDNITDSSISSNTYLVARKESKLLKLFRYIKHVLLKKEFENED